MPDDHQSGKGAILIGASGLIGPYVLARCPEMISVGRTPPPATTPEGVPLGNRHVQVDDVRDLSALEDVEFDRVVYFIGNTNHRVLEADRLVEGEANAWDFHVYPLIHTLEQLKHRPIQKVMHFSSILLFDEDRLSIPVGADTPIKPYKNRYAMSKYVAEELCKFYAGWMPIQNCRFSNIYGPTPLVRHDLIPSVCETLVRDGKAEVWSGAPKRDFIFVEDAADAIAKLLYADTTETVVIGTGRATPVSRVAEILAEVSGCPVDVLDKPVSGPMHIEADTRLQQIIDWQPRVSIEEGVRRVWEVMRRRGAS